MKGPLAAVVVCAAAVVSAAVASHGCGPSCLDDRCSLVAAKPQTTKVDYTKKPGSGGGPSTVAPTGSGSAPAGSGSAVAAGSGSAKPAGSGSAVVAAAGSGSAKPAGSGSAGSGSAAPATSTQGTSWERWDGDQFKMHVITRGPVAANTKISVEFVKTPDRTPFVITLEVREPGGSPAAEAAWNDCPENKIKCDASGTKTHSTKKAGQVLLQAGINWVVNAVTDDAKGTLVTWVNNLSREVLTLRLLK